MFPSFESVAEQLDGVVRALDVAALAPRDAARLVAVVDRIGRQAEAAKVLLAGRAARAAEFEESGARSAAEWLARETGVSRGRARQQLRTADRLAAATGTQEAFKAGRLSAEAAEQIAEIAAVVPGAEAGLLELASSESAKHVRDTCRDIKIRAASRADQDARRARHWQQRGLVTFVGDDLAGEARLRTTTDTLAQLDALLQPHLQAVVDEARRAGRRHTRSAHRHDALLRALRLANPSGATGASVDGPAPGLRPPSPSPSAASTAAPVPAAPAPAATAGVAGTTRGRARRWGGVDAKIIVRVDHTALQRGRAAPGEVCDIIGHGSVDVATVHQILEQADPFLAVVLADAVDVHAVTHLGRKPTAHQRTALEWLHPTCAIEGCDATTALEIDHTPDFAVSRRTRLDELVRLCGHHHDLKRRGFTVERLDGSRRWVLRPPPSAR